MSFIASLPQKEVLFLGAVGVLSALMISKKNNHIVSTQCFEMKFANNEDHKVIFVSSSQNDSNISIVSVAPD